MFKEIDRQRTVIREYFDNLGLKTKIFITAVVAFSLVIIVIDVLAYTNKVRSERDIVFNRIASLVSLLESGDLSFESIADRTRVDSFFDEKVLVSELIGRNGVVVYSMGSPSIKDKFKSSVLDKAIKGAIITYMSHASDKKGGASLIAFYPIVVKEVQIGVLHLEFSFERSNARTREYLLFILGLNFIGLFLTYFFIFFIFTKNIIQRIDGLQQAASRVARGELDKKMAVTSKDELGQLASAFNLMTENLNLVTASRDELNREVAERLKAEERLEVAYKQLKDTQSQLIQSEKMASLGLLSAGVAHEINNPLAFVMGNLSILKTYCDDYLQILRRAEDLIKSLDVISHEEALKRAGAFYELEREKKIESMIEDTYLLLDETSIGLKRVQKIVLDLKTFARADSNTMQHADVNEILDNAIRILGDDFRRKVDVVKDYGQIPLLMCREQRVEQVFINLLLNAAQAIEEHGTIRLVTSVKKDMVCIEVIDNGPGILPENLSKLFDPFFTTKPVGKGTGLGLSVSYDIVKQHQGDIFVESVPGQGAKFTVLLPMKDSSS